MLGDSVDVKPGFIRNQSTAPILSTQSNGQLSVTNSIPEAKIVSDANQELAQLREAEHF